MNWTAIKEFLTALLIFAWMVGMFYFGHAMGW